MSSSILLATIKRAPATSGSNTLSRNIQDRLNNLLLTMYRTDTLSVDYNCTNYWMEVFGGNTKMYDYALPAIQKIVEMADEINNSDIHPWERGRDLIKGMMKGYDTYYKTKVFSKYYKDIDWDKELGHTTYSSASDIPLSQLKDNNLYLVRLEIRDNLTEPLYRFIISGKAPQAGDEVDANAHTQSDEMAEGEDMCDVYMDLVITGVKTIPQEGIKKIIEQEAASSGVEDRFDIYDTIFNPRTKTPIPYQRPPFPIHPMDPLDIQELVKQQTIVL